MAYSFWLVALLLPSVLCVAIVELNQARHLQTDVDMGRPLVHLFETFKQVHNKQYADGREESMRKKIFEMTVQYIQEHNKLYAKGEKSFYLGVNHFSDLTHKEFLGLYVGHMKQTFNTSASTYLSPDNVLLPDSVDWRDHGYVTPVKDQGQCGSCWAFSTTGSLEGQHYKKTNVLVSLSEQQLVDCSGSFGNQGCNGGIMDQAFEYIKSVGGLEDEEDYPYTAEDGKKCKFKVDKEKATVTGYVDILSGSEAKLQVAVATVGPVSIAIDASQPSFQSYAGGVYDEPACSSSKLDHGVLVVGYGTDPSPYWLVKNSWNTNWGDQGYIKMSRNKKNQCGVATTASYPLV